MKNFIYKNELHTVISQDEIKQILHEKYGFPVENISASGAEMWCELTGSKPVKLEPLIKGEKSLDLIVEEVEDRVNYLVYKEIT